jgi:SAM-dependent methyltransferase
VARGDPRAILSSPRAFRSFKQILFPARQQRRFVDRHIRAAEGDRVLDIGCGVADILDWLPEVEYHGFDLSEAYIEAARSRYGSRGHFTCAAVSEMSLGELAGRCNIVIASGMIHHLDDEDALRLMQSAFAALEPGGRLVTFDGCFFEGQRPIARWLISRDRGEHVRALSDYVQLAERVFPEVESELYSDLLRIPYDHLVLEGTKR